MAVLNPKVNVGKVLKVLDNNGASGCAKALFVRLAQSADGDGWTPHRLDERAFLSGTDTRPLYDLSLVALEGGVLRLTEAARELLT